MHGKRYLITVKALWFSRTDASWGILSPEVAGAIACRCHLRLLTIQLKPSAVAPACPNPLSAEPLRRLERLVSVLRWFEPKPHRFKVLNTWSLAGALFREVMGRGSLAKGSMSPEAKFEGLLLRPTSNSLSLLCVSGWRCALSAPCEGHGYHVSPASWTLLYNLPKETRSSIHRDSYHSNRKETKTVTPDLVCTLWHVSKSACIFS